MGIGRGFRREEERKAAEKENQSFNDDLDVRARKLFFWTSADSKADSEGKKKKNTRTTPPGKGKRGEEEKGSRLVALPR